MSYNYQSYFKLIAGKKHFFVKKFLQIKDSENVFDILEGYGMHFEFKKACLIAGIKESEIQQKIFEWMKLNESETKVISINQGLAVIRSITG